MKVLIINHEFPPIGGGAAAACENMAGQLAGGNEVVILTASFGDLPEGKTGKSYVVKRVFSGRKESYAGSIPEVCLFIINGIRFLRKEIKALRPDIVYAFFTLPAGVIALFLKKVYNIPYYVFLRGIDVPGFYGGRFSSLNRILSPLIRYIWLNADRVVANSESLKELAYKTIGLKKEISILPNIIDTDIFHPVKDKDGGGTPKIIFTGRLNKQKGIAYILEAAGILKRRGHTDFILEIVGDGAEKTGLIKKTRDLDIEDKVLFYGWSDKPLLVRKYNEASIFVTAALFEGMPNSVLEAMACGLPVVASDIPSHKELIEDNKNGILFRSGDPDALADALQALLGDKELRSAMGRENISRVAKYDSKKYCMRDHV